MIRASTLLIGNLVHSGKMFMEDGEYVGIASDGVQVILGTVGEEDRLARYLTDHPTPDTW